MNYTVSRRKALNSLFMESTENADQLGCAEERHGPPFLSVLKLPEHYEKVVSIPALVDQSLDYWDEHRRPMPVIIQKMGCSRDLSLGSSSGMPGYLVNYFSPYSINGTHLAMKYISEGRLYANPLI